MRKCLHFILSTFLFCHLGLNLQAQYLKGANKDWVVYTGKIGDTCEVFYYFGNSKLNSYTSISVTIYDDSYRYSNYQYELKVINDSTASLKLPMNIIVDQTKYLHGQFYITDEKLNGRYIGKFQIDILRKDHSINAFIKDYFPKKVITDTFIDFVRLEIIGEKTHFLEPNTTFYYSIVNQFISHVFDSVQIISNELAFVYLPIKSINLIGLYHIYYTNKRDLSVSPKIVSVETKSFGAGKLSIQTTPYLTKHYTEETASGSLLIELPKTDEFNPDSILLHLKGNIQLAHSNGHALPINFETDSIIFDTGGYIPWWSTPRLKLYFRYNLPYYLPTGNYDLIFTHPQIPEARLAQPINLHRPTINQFVNIFPGWPFHFTLKLKPTPSELSNTQFIFEPNAGLHFDSVKYDIYSKDTVRIKVYGHSDSITKDGNYDLQILQPLKHPILLDNGIRVKSNLPQNLKFISDIRLNIGREDSSKRVNSRNLPKLVNYKYLAPIQFTRNGIIEPKITIKPHQNYLLYNTVTFNVDSAVLPGYYDGEIYDTLQQKWFTQKEAIYVMNNFARAIEISPKIIAFTGGGQTRLYTCWFKNSNFSKANEIRLGSTFHSVEVINDTCIQFRGGNGQPAFYNDIDGFIGNDFAMNVVNSPTITTFTPNWMAKSSKSKFTIKADATNWIYLSHIQFYFRKNFVYEDKLKVISYTIINDTLLELELEAGDSLTGTYDLIVYQYPQNSLNGETIYLNKALKLVPVGLSENILGNHKLPILFPNPNKGIFEINKNGHSFDMFDILDFQGRKLYSGSLNEDKIDISPYLHQAGLYLIRLKGIQTITLKFDFRP
jgi:hypothetical protein